MEIAKTIMEQVKTLTPKPVFWSWGASKFQAVLENQIKGLEEQYMGGLLFYVRGQKHTGHVLISLNPSDTYTVSIGRVAKGNMKVKDFQKDVFFDELPHVIDNMIETH